MFRIHTLLLLMCAAGLTCLFPGACTAQVLSYPGVRPIAELQRGDSTLRCLLVTTPVVISVDVQVPVSKNEDYKKHLDTDSLLPQGLTLSAIPDDPQDETRNVFDVFSIGKIQEFHSSAIDYHSGRDSTVRVFYNYLMFSSLPSVLAGKNLTLLTSFTDPITGRTTVKRGEPIPVVAARCAADSAVLYRSRIEWAAGHQGNPVAMAIADSMLTNGIFDRRALDKACDAANALEDYDHQLKYLDAQKAMDDPGGFSFAAEKRRDLLDLMHKKGIHRIDSLIPNRAQRIAMVDTLFAALRDRVPLEYLDTLGVNLDTAESSWKSAVDTIETFRELAHKLTQSNIWNFPNHPSEARSGSIRIGRSADRNWPCLRLNVSTVNDSILARLDQILNSLRHQDGLILDIRGLSERRLDMLCRLAGRFIDKPGGTLILRKRIRGTRENQETVFQAIPEGRHRWVKPLVICSYNTYILNALEAFLGNRSYLHIARNFSSSLASCALPDTIDLGFGFQVSVPTALVLKDDGNWLLPWEREFIIINDECFGDPRMDQAQQALPQLVSLYRMKSELPYRGPYWSRFHLRQILRKTFHLYD